MASELLVKRLMMQASVSVLAGLLMSSAVLAEDTAGDAGDNGEVSISIDDSGMVDGGMVDGGPDVSIDPVDPGDWSGEHDGSAVDDGPVDDGPVDDGAVDDGAVDDGEGVVDPECADCSGVPDVAVDPMEMGQPTDDGVTVTMADGGPRGGAPNERGDTEAGGQDISRDDSHGGGRDSDSRWKTLRVIK